MGLSYCRPATKRTGAVKVRYPGQKKPLNDLAPTPGDLSLVSSSPLPRRPSLGALRALIGDERLFLCLPHEHQENVDAQAPMRSCHEVRSVPKAEILSQRGSPLSLVPLQDANRGIDRSRKRTLFDSALTHCLIFSPLS